MVALTALLTVMSAGCSKDDDPTEENGGHGSLNGNIVSIGGTRDVDYTSAVLLGVVDFTKFTTDHSYGIVYMPALLQTDFDYASKLLLDGHSDRYDKEDYTCISAVVRSSTAEGKFEKQLVGLMPNTTYYYRAYVAIGSMVNYSEVQSFTTQDPSPEIRMSTGEASDIKAVSSILNGEVNVGKLQDVNENQEFGFIYTDAVHMSTADKLTYEYYEQWQMNHLETETEFDEPVDVTTRENLNGRINASVGDLIPGRTYYYRTFFSWNGKYFYSPDVKSFTAKGTSEITVRAGQPDEITSTNALLSAEMAYSLIGKETVECGFMISSKFSNASEFNYDEAVDWDKRDSDPDAAVFKVTTYAQDKNFSYAITDLKPDTYYNVCAFVVLAEYEEMDKGTEKEVTVVAYSPIQSFRTEEPVSNIYFSTDGAYPWTLNNTGTQWTSGNYHVSNSSSTLYATIQHEAGQLFSCRVYVSSESGCDNLTISTNGTTETYSGTTDKEIIYSIRFSNAGTDVIEFTYSKDGSVNKGNDCAKILNWKLE